jgi:microcystin-dependent protein
MKYLIGILFVFLFASRISRSDSIERGNLAVKGTLTVTGAQTLTGVTTMTAAPVLSALTASTVPYLSAGKAITSSAVTPTELGYLSGVTSAIQTQLNAAVGMPTGAVIMFVGSSCPTGYLSLDGSAVSQATYAALYALAGSTYGSDAGGNFTLPNAQGVFIKGSGSQDISGITNSGTRGTTQGDQMQGHYHTMAYSLVGPGTTGANAGDSNSGSVRFSTTASALSPVTDGSNGTPRTGGSTRPANIVLLYCIKT